MNAFVLTSLYLLAAFTGLKVGGRLLRHRTPIAIVLLLFGSIVALDAARWIVTSSLLAQQRELALTADDRAQTYAPAEIQLLDVIGTYVALLAVGLFTISEDLKKTHRRRLTVRNLRSRWCAAWRHGVVSLPLAISVSLIACYYLAIWWYWIFAARLPGSWARVLHELGHASGGDSDDAIVWASSVAFWAAVASILLGIAAGLLAVGVCISPRHRTAGRRVALCGHGLCALTLLASLVLHLINFH